MQAPKESPPPGFDPRYRLLVAPAARKKIADIDHVLEALLAHGKPCVLYVHGRGDEPRKTHDKRIVESMESEYGVKVLMFLWDAKAMLVHRPVARARAAAPHLREVIERIALYRECRPQTRHIPISLLAHSMGAIVLRTALDGCPLVGPAGPLFTNILLTSPDEDAEGHQSWVERLKARTTILITINRRDLILRLSRHESGKTPLGRNPASPLADNAWYLEVTGLVGNAHRVFSTRFQHGHPAIRRIVTAMLRGEKPDLQSGQTIARVEQGRILFPQACRSEPGLTFRESPVISTEG